MKIFRASSFHIPILNIIDVTAEKIKASGFSTIGLLGTRFTMAEEFYKKRLKKIHGFNVLVPSEPDQLVIHRIIVDELSIGKIEKESNKTYWHIIERLKTDGAQGIILGCTEIPLLVRQEEGDIPLFDTTRIHARAAVQKALES